MTVLANAAYGWRPGDPTALVWNAFHDIPSGVASLKSRIRNWLGWRHLFIDATHIDETRLHNWSHQMRRHRTEVIYGYALSIKEIAAYLDTVEVHLPSVRLVVTTAEPLYDADRELIERVFQCPVRDRYASRENGPMAQEDEQGTMRYFANSILLETESPDDESGDFLVTDFWNRAFPFIRYRIGDAAMMRPADADARGMPIIAGLAGRQTDFLIALDGSRVSGMSFHQAYIDQRDHSEGVDSFRQLQFRQQQPDKILVRIVPGPIFERVMDEERLTKIVRKVLGLDMRVVYEYPDEIHRAASGKYRFTINEIED